MNILVTGSAGFIGHHLVKRLGRLASVVVGIDNLNDYYDPGLKLKRLKEVGFLFNTIPDINIPSVVGNQVFIRADIQDKAELFRLFQQYSFDYVIHLAAQAGVRYSLQNPQAYVDSNITGFLNILEACRSYPVKHLIFASSSSVYGLNQTIPFEETHHSAHPVSLYGATKRSNELMAHSYSYLFKVPVTGLRFFTVYGPWGRPDMAYFSFAKKILKNEPIQIFNYGKLKRDFTFIDDVVEGIIRLITYFPTPIDVDPLLLDALPNYSTAPYRVYNIGNNQPVDLEIFINLLEEALGKKAVKEYLPMQPGDVLETYASVDALINAVDFKPNTNLKDGLKQFALWFKEYYTVS